MLGQLLGFATSLARGPAQQLAGKGSQAVRMSTALPGPLADFEDL